MKVFKGIMNVLCIILTVFVALSMLVLLIVTPLISSTLDVVNPDKLTKIVTDIITQTDPGPSAQGPYSSSSTSEGSFSGEMGAELKDYILGEYGEYVTEETLNEILNSKAVQEVIGAYAEDVTNALTGNNAETKFNAETIKQIVNDNMDEIVDILQEVSPELAETDREEIKSTIQTAVDENVEEIVEVLPKPEEIKDTLVEEMPELEIALDILAHRDDIKLALWGAIAILAVLIFALRLFRFSGLLWIAIYTLVGVVFNGVFCIVFKMAPSLISSLAPEATTVGSLLEALLNPLFSSMLTYTLILLGVAVACLVGHIFIQKALRNRRAKLVNLNIPEGTTLYTTCVSEDIFVGSPVMEEMPAIEEVPVAEEDAPVAEESPAEEESATVE